MKEIFGVCLLPSFNHRENDGTLGMVPLIINPIYTLYSGYQHFPYDSNSCLFESFVW